MNERLKELVAQAQTTVAPEHLYHPEFVERLSRLIVQECAGLADQATRENASLRASITDALELAVVAGAHRQSQRLADNIRAHFGMNLP